jgi:DNA-binding CsgD family transcriptional regulator
MQMFAIRRAQGRLAEVALVVRHLVADTNGPAIWRPGLAALYAELGELDDARGVFESLAPARFAAVARDSMWPACLAFLAETCIAIADTERAAELYDELAAFGERNLMVGFTICLGPADRLLGGLAALLGRHDAAAAHFAAALALAERCRSPVWTAEVQADWATLLGVIGDEAGAARLRSQALTTARLIGMGRLTNRPAPAAPAAAPPTRPDGMSDREIEVLRCVAEGLSNRDIGTRLFISQNTVANHVRAILRKTGCANRTEAASYAVRAGL